MRTVHKHLVVIGRLHGDDADRAATYANATVVQARQAFTNELRADAGIREDDVVAGYEFTHVYINHVLTSERFITINEEN